MIAFIFEEHDNMPNNQISQAMQQLMLYFPDRRSKPSYFEAFWIRLDAITAVLKPEWDFQDYKETPAKIIDISFIIVQAYVAVLVSLPFRI